MQRLRFAPFKGCATFADSLTTLPVTYYFHESRDRAEALLYDTLTGFLTSGIPRKVWRFAVDLGEG